MSDPPPPPPPVDPDEAFDELLLSPAERQRWRRQHGQFSTSRKRAKPVAPYDLQRVLNQHKPGYKLKELAPLRARVTDADWHALSPRDASVAAFVERVTGRAWKQPGRAYALEVESPAIRRILQEEGSGARVHLDALLLPLTTTTRRPLVAPSPLQTLLAESTLGRPPLDYLNGLLCALMDELDLMLGALYLFPLPTSDGILALLVCMFNVLPAGALELAQAPAVAFALSLTQERAASHTPSALCVVPWPAPDANSVAGMPQVPCSWATHWRAATRVAYCGCAFVEPRWLMVETTPATHYARVDDQGRLHSGAEEDGMKTVAAV